MEVAQTLVISETGETATRTTTELVATVPLTQMAEGLEMMTYGGLSIARAIVPNFQVLWLSDALTQGHRIPPSYIGMVTIYGFLYIAVALSLAVILFQRREVG